MIIKEIKLFKFLEKRILKNQLNKESTYKYTGPSSLKSVEGRLLEIDAEKSARIHNIKDLSPNSIEIIEEVNGIKYLDVEKSQLQLKYQFILNRRESWLPRTAWSFFVPIVASIITAYITTILIK
jgi:hypothetical protein